MLELKDICKTYKVGDIETKALDHISVAFRQKEFVAILGTSGSGKTTCLNIIGGLDRYDSGEMTIKGKNTKNFKERDWDAYRNNSIGFVFQSYNLIPHLSIVANVEMGMTLSGVSKRKKHEKAMQMLEQVGLKEHLHKKPNQLSGGQMQRVAIARALANDPEILLCDEPTGSLDSATSIQIMDLIKEVAKDRLVIMVTHNPQLAEQYADRIISFQDGRIVSDTHPHQERPKEDQFSLKKTSMNFLTALGLSFNNIKTKKWRTFLTCFASSIGIIGIAVVLSLSSGFQIQINQFQSDALSEYPITISATAMNTDEESMAQAQSQMRDQMTNDGAFVQSDEVYLYDPSSSAIVHQNKLTDAYIDYIENIDPEICKSIGYIRTVNMNLIGKNQEGDPITVTFGADENQNNPMAAMTSMAGIGLSTYPEYLDASKTTSYLQDNYDLLSGAYPTEATDLVLVVDEKNRIDVSILKNIGFDTENIDSYKFTDLIGTEFKLVSNDDYYVKTQFETYMPNQDLQAMYDNGDDLTLRISGIVRVKEDAPFGLLGEGIAYSDRLSQIVLDRAADSEVVRAQQEADYNILTREPLDADTKEQLLAYLGGNASPYMIMVYPENFEDKEAVLQYLDDWNAGKSDEDTVIYTDLASALTNMTSGIMDAITIVLVAFAAISLFVSLIMICIITYTSVLERTKEIGILKALGARKRDIARVFDAETCLLGVFSGVLGIGIAYLCTFPINALIYHLTEVSNVAQLNPLHAVILVVISTVLTMLGGHIPARMAAKKDAVEALRSE